MPAPRGRPIASAWGPITRLPALPSAAALLTQICALRKGLRAEPHEPQLLAGSPAPPH